MFFKAKLQKNKRNNQYSITLSKKRLRDILEGKCKGDSIKFYINDKKNVRRELK